MAAELTACVLVEKDGKVLLAKRKNKTFNGYWCVPGGHAEPGETPQQAAQREAGEEIGDVKVEQKPFLVFVHDWPADSHTGEPHQHRCHAFRARATGKLRPGSDAGELGWFTPREAMGMEITGYTWTVLDHILSQ